MVKSQDIIIKKDGTPILAQIVDKDAELELLKFSHYGADSTLYLLPYKDIKTIKYADGRITEFSRVYESQTSDKVSILKPGLFIPIKATRNYRASELQKGETVSFIVAKDIVIDNEVVVPFGSPVYGQVYEAKRSSWWGTKGRLGIVVNSLLLPTGDYVKLAPTKVYVTGKNRTTLSVCLFLFVIWPACFICGSMAEIPNGYEFTAQVVL